MPAMSQKLLIALTTGIAIAGTGFARHQVGGTVKNARVASATLRTPDGTEVGHATAREVKNGLRISIETTGLPEGMHGAHIHTTGKCEGPGFASAGGHWNPLNTQHGTLNPAGPHEGDLPNLVIGKTGRGVLAINVPMATMDGLLDADGSAIVIHAGVDDMKTDPSGNSGGRIACGVFEGR